MSYYAQFDLVSNARFRFDTRIYLDGNPASPRDGICVAAIASKNPRSARSATIGTWGSLDLVGDKMLPYVKNRFIEAYELAGKTIPKDAFVRVWNLFYLCDKNLASALKAIKFRPQKIRAYEESTAKIIWFAWGGDNKQLNPFKKRFLDMRPAHAFFFDKHSNRICTTHPTITSFAKHPHGLRATPVIEHLATIL